MGATPEVGVPALLAGKHVIIEKPMEVTLEACDRLLEAQRASGRTLAVVSQHRFDTAAQRVHEAVTTAGSAAWCWPSAASRGSAPRSTTTPASGAAPGSSTAAGALINQGVHTVDLLRWMCGPVESVYAQARTATHERIEVEDVVCATVTFTDGAIATVMASTSAFPGFPASLSLHGTAGGAVIHGDRLATLVLTDGTALGGETTTAHAQQVASGGTRAATRAVDEASDLPVDPADVWGEAHRLQLLDFADAVVEGRAPLVDGVSGRQSLELVLAIYESARTGDVVRP